MKSQIRNARRSVGRRTVATAPTSAEQQRPATPPRTARRCRSTTRFSPRPGPVLGEPVVEARRRCPSQSPPGFVRKTVNSTREDGDEGRERPGPRLPADAPRRRATTGASRNPCTRACTASATRKNVPATKTVMNVVSFVAKLSASSAPISAGWWRARPLEEPERDGDQRQRDRGEVDVLAREAAVVEEGRAEGERDGGGERADPPELAAQEAGQRAPSACPSARARGAR